MSRTLTRVGIVGAVVAAAMSVAPMASAAPAPDKELCKSGGFADYVDPTTGAPFKNQGRCVSFVNGGGVLVPVQEQPPVPVAPTVTFDRPIAYGGGSNYIVNGQLQGQPNTQYLVVMKIDGVMWNSYYITTNADGLAPYNLGVVNPDLEITIHNGIDGPVIGSITTPPCSWYLDPSCVPYVP